MDVLMKSTKILVIPFFFSILLSSTLYQVSTAELLGSSKPIDISTQGDWLVRALSSKPKTLTPFLSGDMYTSKIQNYVLESLLSRDSKTLEWAGLLAKKWSISDDGLSITFELREGIVFSDGEPLSASDVVFTYNFIMNDKINAPAQRSYLKLIKNVKALNSHTVIFTYHKPFFQALGLAGRIKILPKHFYKRYLKYPQEFNKSTSLLLGSGPYQLKFPNSWNPSLSHIELLRNNHYSSRKQPSFNRLLWQIINTDSARLVAYRNGTIDTYEVKANAYQKLKNDPQISQKSHQINYMALHQGYNYIAWNSIKNGADGSLFADKRIRQAMTYLTNRDKIIDYVFKGQAEIAVSPFNIRSKQHDTSITPFEYNLKKAQQLLKDSGFIKKNKYGVLENTQGKPFSFKLSYPQHNDDRKRMVLLLKDEYAKAGIELIPDPQESNVLYKMMDNKNYEALTLGWAGGGVETDIFLMFHSSQANPEGYNFISYKNPEMDRLIDLTRSTVDESQRMKMWQKIEKILHDDQPYTFLYRRRTLLFIDKRFKNLKTTKLGLNLDLLPLEVFVPKSEQKYKH
jgi:peptide/nickel transport system substrate-binding protein